jgi:nitrite reductase (NADH) small subunit
MNARTLPEMISIATAPATPPEASGNWIDVCALEDIPRLGSRIVPREALGAPAVAVFRTATDTVFALDDRCPHKGGPLSQGIVHGDRVACPLHNWSIELPSGSAVAPDQGCTRRHAVRIVDGRVQLDVAALAAN